MIGLLRYAFLRGLRDSTLVTLLASPAVMVSMPVLASWLSGRNVPMPPPQAGAAMILFFAALMGSLASFMAFRSEISTRAIGAFVLAAPSWLIPVACTLYGWIVGLLASTICAACMVATGWGVFTDPGTRVAAEWGAFIGAGTLAVNVAAIGLAAAAVGTMGVMISSSFSTVGWIYAGLIAIIGFIQGGDGASGIELLGVVLVALISTGIAAVIVERRCAT